MACWEQLGENARAVRHYEELAVLLREQVGVPPAAETTALYERLTGSRLSGPLVIPPVPVVPETRLVPDSFPPLRLGGTLSDPITPPAARWPAEAPELVSLAVSDGDPGAALAQYGRGALLRPWTDDERAG